MSKAITPFFKRLGAPLANSRWSWGAERADGVIFMRVWQDEVRKIESELCCRVTKHARFQHDPTPGYNERLEHIKLVRNGRTCFLVMCEASDIKAIPRSIKDFNEDEVFEGGRIVDFDGDQWIELGSRHPVAAVAATNA